MGDGEEVGGEGGIGERKGDGAAGTEIGEEEGVEVACRRTRRNIEVEKKGCWAAPHPFRDYFLSSWPYF